MTEPTVRVTTAEADVQIYESAAALARAFGSTVLEPTWWPTDVHQVQYRVERFSNHVQYVIHSGQAQANKVVTVIGHAYNPADRQPAGHWYQAAGLDHFNGRIGTVGLPPRLQAVLRSGKLAIEMLGYGSEADIVRAARSLRAVTGQHDE